MSIVIKGFVNVGHSYTGANGDFEHNIEDLGITQDEWLSMNSHQREDFLNDILDTEIGNTLEAAIWVEGEED